MKFFQIEDLNGFNYGLFTCPDVITDEIFEHTLAGFDFNLDEFSENNTIGAERVFVEIVPYPL